MTWGLFLHPLLSGCGARNNLSEQLSSSINMPPTHTHTQGARVFLLLLGLQGNPVGPEPQYSLPAPHLHSESVFCHHIVQR